MKTNANCFTNYMKRESWVDSVLHAHPEALGVSLHFKTRCDSHMWSARGNNSSELVCTDLDFRHYNFILLYENCFPQVQVKVVKHLLGASNAVLADQSMKWKLTHQGPGRHDEPGKQADLEGTPDERLCPDFFCTTCRVRHLVTYIYCQDRNILHSVK